MRLYNTAEEESKRSGWKVRTARLANWFEVKDSMIFWFQILWQQDMVIENIQLRHHAHISFHDSHQLTVNIFFLQARLLDDKLHLAYFPVKEINY